MREAQIKADIEAGLTMQQALERQGGEGAIRQSGATYRIGTVPHHPFWTGRESYGLNPNPVNDITLFMTPKARTDAALRADSPGYDHRDATIV